MHNNTKAYQSRVAAMGRFLPVAEHPACAAASHRAARVPLPALAKSLVALEVTRILSRESVVHRSHRAYNDVRGSCSTPSIGANETRRVRFREFKKIVNPYQGIIQA
jgi:hypothetical protein